MANVSAHCALLFIFIDMSNMQESDYNQLQTDNICPSHVVEERCNFRKHGDAEEAGMGCRVRGSSARQCKTDTNCTEIYSSGRLRQQQICCDRGQLTA